MAKKCPNCNSKNTVGGVEWGKGKDAFGRPMVYQCHNCLTYFK